MKLLITGGCGFLGSNLSAYALLQGVDLCIFDSLYRPGSRTNLQWLRTLGKFDFTHGDIRNPNDVNRVISRVKPDVIFHLAGQVAMTKSIDDPRMDFEVNALGTLNLLEAVRFITPEALVVYSSTNKVYGDLEQYDYIETDTRYVCLDHPNGFDEYIPLDFHSPYGCSKGSADQYLRDYHRIFGLNTVVFRHSSIYGGRQFATVDQGWVGWFCKMASDTIAGKIREPFTISGNGKQVRDIVSVDDVALVYFEIVNYVDTVAGEAFNIGGGVTNSLSLVELFTLLESEIEKPLSYRTLPARSSDQRVFVADIAKIQRKTSWTPRISATVGIRNMFEWMTSFDGFDQI